MPKFSKILKLKKRNSKNIVSLYVLDVNESGPSPMPIIALVSVHIGRKMPFRGILIFFSDLGERTLEFETFRPISEFYLLTQTKRV